MRERGGDLPSPTCAAKARPSEEETTPVMEAIAVIALFVIAFGVLNLIEFGRID
jgi:hypothetical protein